ncbi:MAG: hypothetical protein M3063_15190 [Actinomycetota bacterium]|nr:hypothetical protein [Actinomycetota bacterium]
MLSRQGEGRPYQLRGASLLSRLPVELSACSAAFDPRDYARPGVAVITSRLLRARPGDILLCHDGGGNRSETVTTLSTVLPTLLKNGLTFVTL